MSRLSATNDAAARADIVRLRYFCELDFSTGPVRVWDGLGSITTLGRTFFGLGELTSISEIEEAGEISPRNVIVSLSGVPSEYITAAQVSAYRGRRALIWEGFMAPDGVTLLATPDVAWGGRMDTCTISDDLRAGTSAVSVNIESRLVDLRRPRTRRYSHEEQLRRYPGDLGCQFVSRLSERPIYFGARGPAGVPGYS